MFKILFHILLLASFNQGIAQVHHQMISSQGSTSETSTGYVVTQTIGQSSVVGNYTNSSVKINQGYQQPFWGGLELSNVPDFTASIFPNDLESIKLIADTNKNIGSAYAPNHPTRRISCNKTMLSSSTNNALMILGKKKLKILQNSMDKGLPISEFSSAKNELNVYYAE